MYSIWGENEPSLDKVDCRERVMLHEYLHLPWTKNMNPVVDYVGYANAVGAAAIVPWGSVRALPDCYAWYALYSAYNNDHQGCGRDIWPLNVEKPVAA